MIFTNIFKSWGTVSEQSEKLWYRAARTIAKVGKMPMPISSTVIELLKLIMTEEQAQFILNFKTPTLNLEQIKEKLDISKVDDGVIIRFKDPSAMENPQLQMMMNPDQLASMGQMFGGEGGGMSLEVERLDDGIKMKTDDPDALYELIMKMFNIEFMQEMIKEMMGNLLGQLGNVFSDSDDDLADE